VLIKTREELYIRAADRLGKAQTEVIDTTWGRAPAAGLNKNEEAARQKYLLAARAAMDRGVKYHEIYSGQPSIEPVAESGNTRRRFSAVADVPIFDVLVIDSSVSLLSRVHTPEGGGDEEVFLEVEGRSLTGFLREFLLDCWREGQAV
jgi:hypothetical protein